jgi:hypothetical protein
VNKSYSELIKLPTFEERYNYLKLDGLVGEDTFGSRRFLNQMFYRSEEWKQLRHKIIVRDQGLDLGIRDVGSTMLYIHHINPITIEDIEKQSLKLLDPENLIAVTKSTHDAIHYGSLSNVKGYMIERTPFDTCPWKS